MRIEVGTEITLSLNCMLAEWICINLDTLGVEGRGKTPVLAVEDYAARLRSISDACLDEIKKMRDM